jgi:hypothetical protein
MLTLHQYTEDGMLTVEGEGVRVVERVLAFDSIVVNGLPWFSAQG